MTPEEYDQQLAQLVTDIGDRIAAGETLDLATVCEQNAPFANELRELWGTIVVTQVAGHEKSSPLSSSPADSSQSIFELPFEMGDYTLLEELGRGGMGIVYRAIRRSDREPVAIKMILKGEFASDLDRKRFETEIVSASKLEHPNVVPVYEVGDFQGRAYFCMKLVDGHTLADVLAKGPLPARRAAVIMQQISAAIGAAHERGILHRDLKPSNILLDADDRAYVADFGLAKTLEGPQSLTRSGAILGTPSYMAPEQAAGARGQVTTLSDVYSLGAILYHALTGRPPFLAATPVDTVLMVLEQDPIPPRELNRAVDRNLEMIAMRCLQKPQDLRYSTASDLALDLQAFLEDRPISAREGRFAQVIANIFRDTHHAAVLENWGVLWMWHSLVLLAACFATNILYLRGNGSVATLDYWIVWAFGFGTWAIVFWFLRRRMGPVTFVERQIVHIWAASMITVAALNPLGNMLDMEDFELTPVIAILATMVFLVKAGILSGVFYFCAAALLATAFLMVLFLDYSMFIFGVVSAGCFFFSGLKYYRQRQISEQSG